MNHPSNKLAASPKPSRRMLSKAVVTALVFVVLIPVLLGKTFLRDIVLNSLVDLSLIHI